ncbi:MAG: hypothetical protein ABFD14_03845 [Anaerolineaceae bacterium]
MTANYEVYISNKAGERVAQVTAFTTLEMVRRFNTVGSWYITADAAALAELTTQGGIMVYRNGVLFFTGSVNAFEDVSGLTITANGSDDLDMIAGLLALPVPGGAPYNVDYDVRTGIAETVIKQYVNLNAGPGAISIRRVGGLTIETDNGRGGQATGRARFEKLIDLIRSLAVQGGNIGFRILAGQFGIYIPTDKSDTIIFSKELGTLGDYRFSTKRGEENALYIGGAGTGSARTIYEMSDPTAVVDWGRREAFLDKGNTSDATELAAAGAEELAKKSGETILTITPMPTALMQPIDNYDIGDWVKAVIRGQVIKQQVREIKTTLSSTGESNELAIGTEGASTDTTGLAGIYSRMRGLDKRVNTMERR